MTAFTKIHVATMEEAIAQTYWRIRDTDSPSEAAELTSLVANMHDVIILIEAELEDVNE